LQQLQQLKLPQETETEWNRIGMSSASRSSTNSSATTSAHPTHYFCGGNMFIYYSVEQAKEIEEYVEGETVQKKPRFKGPDFFLVKEVDGTKPRESWVVWEEDGRYPDLVVEFISSSTRRKDVDKNVRFYERVFRVPEYFWFDRRVGELVGHRLVGWGICADRGGWSWLVVE
jgi:Uma2 family endonuclease